VQEVKIQTALYDAEYGHGGGTVLNTVLRSGGNDYHGAAYFVFRNTYMDANTYERVPNQNGATNPASPSPRVNETWDEPGAVLDGPVRIPHIYDGRDKTFFMAHKSAARRTLFQHRRWLEETSPRFAQEVSMSTAIASLAAECRSTIR
jgi:hypothetical protein